jgi:hypothetical protein
MTGPRVLLPEQKAIPIHNGWVTRQEIRYFSDAMNDWIPWIGTDIRVRLSRFPTGYDFSGYPSTILGPRTMTAISDPGWFYATFTADEITNALTNFVGQTVYQVVEADYGSSAAYYALTNVQPMLVIDPRAPIP